MVEKTSPSDNEIFNIISRGLLNFGEYIYTTDGLRLVNKNYVDNSITPDKVTFFNKTYNTDNYINPEKIIQNFVLSYTTGNVFPNND